MVKDERVFGNLILKESNISWGKGQNNYVFCDNTYGDVVLEKSTISFVGSNAVIYIMGGNKKSLKIKATLSPDSCIYIGHDSSFHKTATCHLATSEQANIVIGDDCMFSQDIWLRTSDAHPIYSVATKERLNYPKDILIGDHVWIGQEVMILKGSVVGSGSVLGARATLTNKQYFSNSSYAGTPARMISEEGAIFFDKTDLNAANKEKSKKFDKIDKDDFIFKYNKDTCIINDVLTFLKENKDPNVRIEYFKNLSKDKNRFALSSKQVGNKQAFGLVNTKVLRLAEIYDFIYLEFTRGS